MGIAVRRMREADKGMGIGVWHTREGVDRMRAGVSRMSEVNNRMGGGGNRAAGIGLKKRKWFNRATRR